MRILHVLHNYPPEFRGGVERAVEQTVAAQRRRGDHVTVLAGSEQTRPEATLVDQEVDGTRVIRLHKAPGLRQPVDVFDPDVPPLYERVLDEVRPEIVHVHHWWNLCDDLVRRAVHRGVSTCVTLHDWFTTCSLFFRMPEGSAPCRETQGPAACAPCIGERFGVDATELEAWVANRAAWYQAELAAAGEVLAPSEAHASGLQEFVGSKPRIRSLPLGSPALAVPSPCGTPFPDGPLRILHHGHLSRLKGVQVLVDAVRAADPSGERIRLTLLGDPIEDDLDLEGVERVGGDFTREDLVSLAGAADLAAYPSLALETYGLTVDEALRLGLPVVVSDRGALAERIGGRGVVVPGGDVAALASVFRGFLDDPKTLVALREGEAPELTSPDDHARALDRHYTQILRRPLPSVDLEGPLRDRIRRWHARMGEVLHLLGQLRSASSTSGATDEA